MWFVEAPFEDVECTDFRLKKKTEKIKFSWNQNQTKINQTKPNLNLT